MSIKQYQHLGLKFKDETEYKRKIRERDNYTCQLCGCFGYDVDHIIPWYLSHDSTLSNLRVLCHRCNLKNRRQTLPAGKTWQLPYDEWCKWLESELSCIPI